MFLLKCQLGLSLNNGTLIGKIRLLGCSFVTSHKIHRMFGVGRNLWESSSPSPLPNQGRLERVTQDLVEAGSEYLQRRRIHSLSGQPDPVLRHPQREEVLPHVQTELPMLQFVPISSCPVTGHH